MIPCFNGARFLRCAIDSVLSQTDDDVEIIVSDDGSTDGTTRIIDEFTRTRRVIAVDGPRKGNWVTNTNRAVEHANGSLLTILHQDDVWLDGRLAALREGSSRHAVCALWLNASRFINDGGRDIGAWRLPFGPEQDVVPSSLFLEKLLVQNFVAMPAPAFRLTDFRDMGGMDETLWFTADWDLWLRLAARGPVYMDRRQLTGFRIHRDSQTARGSVAEMRTQTERVRNNYLQFIPDPETRARVAAEGRASQEINAALASIAARSNIDWMALLGSVRGVRSMRHVVSTARLRERLSARIRAALSG